MKLNLTWNHLKLRRRGFSLVESVIGMGVVGIISSGLFASFSLGFTVIRLSREEARATQVMMEKLEVFRLYSWNQVTNQTFVPNGFVAPFVAVGADPGFYYTGTVTIASAPLGTSYDEDLRQVTVDLDWNSKGIQRHREVTTYVSRYGIQNYTY